MINVEYLDVFGYVVETEQAIYVFDYTKGQLPSHYLLSKKPLYFFVSRDDIKHYSTSIFSYRKPVFMHHDIKGPSQDDIFRISNGDTLYLGRTKITVLQVSRQGLAFVIKEPGLAIFYAGDLNHKLWRPLGVEKEDLNTEILLSQFLERIEQYKPFDIAFTAVNPNVSVNPDATARRIIQSLEPSCFFPMDFEDKPERISRLLEWGATVKNLTIYQPLYANHEFKNIEVIK